jgi:membrane associated rhomboid family serine protease
LSAEPSSDPYDLPPQRREPIFSVPGVVLGCIAVFVAIHALRVYVLSDTSDESLLALFAFVPAGFTFLYDPQGVVAAVSTLPGAQGIGEPELRALLSATPSHPWTVLTYALLHGDWMHLGVNSIWFVAFGTPVARRIGAWRFLALCVVTALAGAGLHYLTHRFDVTPVIGASASVSGIMAYAARFVFQPGAPLGSSLGFARRGSDDAYKQAALPFVRLFAERRVVSFLAIWLVVNLIFGLISQPLGLTQSAVAWEAHVGGFLAGLLLFPLFDRDMPHESLMQARVEDMQAPPHDDSSTLH